MAKYSGLIKIKGRVGNLVFVDDRFNTVRSVVSHRAKMMREDEEFEKLRLSQNEFGLASSFGKIIRNALEPYTSFYKDTLVSSRLTGVLFNILKMDSKPIGQREICLGDFSNLLIGFDFNAVNQPLDTVLDMDSDIEDDGNITLSLHLKKQPTSDLYPVIDVLFLQVPKNINHLTRLKGLRAVHEQRKFENKLTYKFNVDYGMVGLLVCGLSYTDGTNYSRKGMKVFGILT